MVAIFEAEWQLMLRNDAFMHLWEFDGAWIYAYFGDGQISSDDDLFYTSVKHLILPIHLLNPEYMPALNPLNCIHLHV